MEDVNTAHFLWRVVGALVVLFLVKKVPSPASPDLDTSCYITRLPPRHCVTLHHP